MKLMKKFVALAVCAIISLNISSAADYTLTTVANDTGISVCNDDFEIPFPQA